MEDKVTSTMQPLAEPTKKATAPKVEKPLATVDYQAEMVKEIKELAFNSSDTIEVVVKVYNGAMGAVEYPLPHTAKAIKAMKA